MTNKMETSKYPYIDSYGDYHQEYSRPFDAVCAGNDPVGAAPYKEERHDGDGVQAARKHGGRGWIAAFGRAGAGGCVRRLEPCRRA